MGTGLEAYNDAGYLQFSSDNTYQLRFISKGVVTLGQPVTYSSQSSATINTPKGLIAPIVAFRSQSSISPFNSSIASDGSGTFYFISNGAPGGTCAYYIFDGGPKAVSTSGTGLEIYNADGTLCFSSNVGFFNVTAVLNGYGAQASLQSGKLYASFIPSFSGFLHQQTAADESGNTNGRRVQTTGAIGCVVDLPNGNAQIVSVPWQDSQSAPVHSNIDMPAVPVFLLDVTTFGQISGEATYSASISPQTASQQQQQTSSYTFPAETVSLRGSAPSPTYNWSIANANGGNWSISSGQGTSQAQATVTGVADGTKVSANLVCTVTSNNNQQTVSSTLSYYSTPNPNAVAVAMSPGDQNIKYNGSNNPTYNFSQESISVTNGSASSYSWSISSNDGNGNWSISSNNGSSTVPTCSGVTPGASSSAVLICNTVVNGQTYRNKTNLSFTNTYASSGGQQN